MLNSLLKDLFLWLYSLFLDLISYCANALLGVMTTNLAFFENSVPVVGSLYGIMRAVGWGLLIGNCVFQAMRAMCAGLGFESENPAILLIRTGIYGFLLIFSRSICDICLSIGGKVIELIGIPENIDLSFPTEAAFGAGDSSWLLVIIIGFVLGFQLIKLFFEIGERYVVVAILTLMCPVGLAMGGSKTTKDICTGYLRCFGSMILLMVMNVVFLKLILSGLSIMPTGALVLPWCVLLTGIARVARKADSLLSKIGLNPATTGDPLSHGGGKFIAMMAARSIMNSAMKSKSTVGKNTASSKNNSNFMAGNNRNNSAYTGGNQNSNFANRANSQTTGNTQSSANNGSNMNNTASSNATAVGNAFSGGSVNNMPGGNTRVNTNRFGAAPVTGQMKQNGSMQGNRATNSQKRSAGAGTQAQKSSSQQPISQANKPVNQRNSPVTGNKPHNNAGRFGSGMRFNANKNRTSIPKTETLRTNANSAVRFGQSAKPPEKSAPEVVPPTDTEENKNV